MADGDVQVPLAGRLPQKKLLIGAAVLAAGFVGWKYWQARQTSDGESPITDGEFGAVDTSVPGVIGAVSPTNSYGSDTGSTDDQADGSNLKTNAAWTAYARQQLAGVYDDAAVATALGNFLGRAPTSDDQQTIIRAAIAAAGYPPVGSYAIIPGGNTTVSLAPGDLRVQTSTPTSVSLAWNPVAGADNYRLEYGTTTKTVSGSSTTATGLTAGTSYTFRVSALNGAGTPGPASTVTAKTPAVQPSGSRGYGWWKSNGKTTMTQLAKTYRVPVTDLQRWNPNLPAKPAKGVYVKIRENSNPLTGYKG
jgi:hypothetical protein